MNRVHHIDPAKTKDLQTFLDSMEKVGVLGAGRLGRAARIIQRMFEDPDCFTFLSMSGPMVPGGLRNVVSHLIESGKIDAIVTHIFWAVARSLFFTESAQITLQPVPVSLMEIANKIVAAMIIGQLGATA